ncbi:hypothetical protein SELMODRAFT_87621 [Selaginella moellendorffii]|uniref:Long-chain-alcohol oxidase n=1 Tax=Selaginella moellendorffii TaxID=88036 RepID=D8R6Z5_SELML|nr:hypothetical protein SELMODRAFT_87621 [Selaginella moellendorffii]
MHPDLQGGQAPFAHSLDPPQLEAVAAICDTFLPALPLRALECEEEAQRAFFATSASDAGIPAQVAGWIFECLDSAQQAGVLRVLSLLSSRIGTLILCGRHAFSAEFPFLHRFARLPASNRERTLRSWSGGSIAQFHSLYKLFKCFAMFAFFTKADARGRNDSWKAIGYPVPDPLWNGLKDDDDAKVTDDNEEPRPPLRVFDVHQNSAAELVDYLSSSKFRVSEEVRDGGDGGSGQAMLAIDCDVVVIGSGCGGGVCAGVLSQKGYKVVVIEKGKYYVGDQLSLLEGPSMRAMYEGGGLLTTADGGINLMAGSTVGGGTVMNWAASLRTPQAVREEWSSVHGLKLFTSEEYEAAMDKVCERLGVETLGNEEEHESFQNKVLRSGCKKIGLDVETIPTNCRGRRHKCGLCGFGCKSRTKQGTHETWLMDAVDAGAVILCGCNAERILLEPGELRSAKQWKAGGVIATGGGKSLFIRAKATVTSCGALNTPVLLQKSGLVNRHIGSNLHLHPSQLLWGYVPSGEGLPAGRISDGPIMSAVSRIADAVLEVPAFYPGGLGVMFPWRSGLSFKEQMLRYSRLAHVVVITRDRGSGTVRPSSSSSSQLPKVTYTISAEDEKTLKAGAEKAIRVLIAAGAVEVGTQHPDGDSLVVEGSDEKALEKFLRVIGSKQLTHAAMATASAHQMGSCRMGNDPASSAVDPRGEAWESTGLFVADTSVFPTALGVNPMVTAQSVALCIAKSVHRFLEEERL